MHFASPRRQVYKRRSNPRVKMDHIMTFQVSVWDCSISGNFLDAPASAHLRTAITISFYSF